MSTASSRVRMFLIASAIIFLTIGPLRLALVFSVDPFERFMTDPTNVSTNRERESKPWFIKSSPHNAVLIGTSKLAYVDPDDVDTPELKFFNASFAGAVPEEMYSFLRLFVPRARLVVISLDIITMNEDTWSLRPTDWGQRSFQDAAIAGWDYLTSHEALKMSIIYALNGRPERSMLKANGARHAPGELARSDAMTTTAFEGPLATLRGAAFDGFNYSEARIGYLEKIKKLLDDRHIKHIVLISPESEAMLDMIERSGNKWALERFRADVKGIFPDAVDYSRSWMSDNSNFLKFDPLHYLPTAGEKMVREALERHTKRLRNQ